MVSQHFEGISTCRSSEVEKARQLGFGRLAGRGFVGRWSSSAQIEQRDLLVEDRGMGWSESWIGGRRT